MQGIPLATDHHSAGSHVLGLVLEDAPNEGRKSEKKSKKKKKKFKNVKKNKNNSININIFLNIFPYP
jgi:hypothetical protein